MANGWVDERKTVVEKICLRVGRAYRSNELGSKGVAG